MTDRKKQGLGDLGVSPFVGGAVFRAVGALLFVGGHVW